MPLLTSGLAAPASFTQTATCSSVSGGPDRLTLDNLNHGLLAEEVAWGHREVLLQIASKGRKKWLDNQPPWILVRLYAAAFRVARIKKNAMRLAMAGQPQDAFGWINADRELALCQTVLAAAFLHDGEFGLL